MPSRPLVVLLKKPFFFFFLSRITIVRNDHEWLIFLSCPSVKERPTSPFGGGINLYTKNKALMMMSRCPRGLHRLSQGLRQDIFAIFARTMYLKCAFLSTYKLFKAPSWRYYLRYCTFANHVYLKFTET